MKFNKLFSKKICLCSLFLVAIVIIFLYRYYKQIESFEDDLEEIDIEDIENFDSQNKNLIEPNNGHATENMLRHGIGSSVASSGLTKKQGLCCVQHGCVSCNGKYPDQKTYGCKKWDNCCKNKVAKHELQTSCTGCGAEKKAILSTQEDNWW